MTASAGNMAQGLAANAKRLGCPCTTVVPEHAPAAKLEAIERLGGRIIKVPFPEWWQIIESSECPQAAGYFVHPVLDQRVVAGNSTSKAAASHTRTHQLRPTRAASVTSSCVPRSSPHSNAPAAPH